MEITEEFKVPDGKVELGVFERYSTLWIALCIVAGLLVGRFIPQFGQFMDSLKFSKVSIPIGILLFFYDVPYGSGDTVQRHKKSSCQA